MGNGDTNPDMSYTHIHPRKQARGAFCCSIASLMSFGVFSVSGYPIQMRDPSRSHGVGLRGMGDRGAEWQPIRTSR